MFSLAICVPHQLAHLSRAYSKSFEIICGELYLSPFLPPGRQHFWSAWPTPIHKLWWIYGAFGYLRPRISWFHELYCLSLDFLVQLKPSYFWRTITQATGQKSKKASLLCSTPHLYIHALINRLLTGWADSTRVVSHMNLLLMYSMHIAIPSIWHMCFQNVLLIKINIL